MKSEQMLKLRYETDMPAGDQIVCYLSCNVRINKGELKQKDLLHNVSVHCQVGPTYPMKITTAVLNHPATLTIDSEGLKY